MRRLILVLTVALGLGVPIGGWAVQPDEMLTNPVLEARARDISRGLRCLVCQNQSIDESDAGLARDLRLIVRERLVAGDSDQAVIDFVVARYGDFVLLNPPFKSTTYLLWFSPPLVGALGIVAVVAFFRRRAQAVDAEAPAPLSRDEQRRLAGLMREDRR